MNRACLTSTFMLVLLALILPFAPVAYGHEIKPALLGIAETETPNLYDVKWKVPIREGVKLNLDPIFPDHCEISTRGFSERSTLAFEERWALTCEGASLDGHDIHIAGLDSSVADVFVETAALDGTSGTFVLRSDRTTLTVDFSSGGALGDYLFFGIEHLLTGFDHILFVVGLVLLIRKGKALVKVVTSFTVAHSMTLALSSLGLVKMSQAPIEAVIALSIMFLGVELIRANQGKTSILQQNPWVITFLFGLLHGFGFAGALGEIGLPQGAASLALLLFNLGVEVGQLLIVAVMLGALALLPLIARKTSDWSAFKAASAIPALTFVRANPMILPAYAIGVTASYWFVERVIGILF